MAIDIIGDTGVSGLTTARLAKRLGMSEPNLYRHFNNKEAILSAVIDDIGAVIMDKAAFISGQDISPEENWKILWPATSAKSSKEAASRGFFFLRTCMCGTRC